jgi:hypothetical protein
MPPGRSCLCCCDSASVRTRARTCEWRRARVRPHRKDRHACLCWILSVRVRLSNEFASTCSAVGDDSLNAPLASGLLNAELREWLGCPQQASQLKSEPGLCLLPKYPDRARTVTHFSKAWLGASVELVHEGVGTSHESGLCQPSRLLVPDSIDSSQTERWITPDLICGECLFAQCDRLRVCISSASPGA